MFDFSDDEIKIVNDRTQQIFDRIESFLAFTEIDIQSFYNNILLQYFTPYQIFQERLYKQTEQRFILKVNEESDLKLYIEIFMSHFLSLKEKIDCHRVVRIYVGMSD